MIFLSLVGGALSPGEIRGGSVPRGSLGPKLFADKWGCVPTQIIIWPRASQPDGWGQIFPKWPSLEEYTLMIIPENFDSNVLPPQQATVTLFSQEILQELQSGLTQIPMESLLCPGTQCTSKSVCTFQVWGLCFPQSCGATAHKPH